MTDPLLPARPDGPLLPDRPLDERYRRLVNEAIRNSKSENTQRAYASAIRKFSSWCSQEERSPLPADSETVAAHLAWLAREGNEGEPMAFSSIAQARSALAFMHAVANLPSPCSHPKVKAVLQGVRRTAKKERGKKALVREELGKMVRLTTNLRDRALLLLGFRGAFRRSELVALDVGDVEVLSDRLVVTISKHVVRSLRKAGDPARRAQGWRLARGSKASLDDQRIAIGKGPTFDVVTALMKDRPPGEPLFKSKHGTRLTPAQVAKLVKRLAKKVGLNPRDFGAHSLRSGFVTECVKAGISIFEIQKQTRHASISSVEAYYKPLEAALREDAFAGLDPEVEDDGP